MQNKKIVVNIVDYYSRLEDKKIVETSKLKDLMYNATKYKSGTNCDSLEVSDDIEILHTGTLGSIMVTSDKRLKREMAVFRKMLEKLSAPLLGETNTDLGLLGSYTDEMKFSTMSFKSLIYLLSKINPRNVLFGFKNVNSFISAYDKTKCDVYIAFFPKIELSKYELPDSDVLLKGNTGAALIKTGIYEKLVLFNLMLIFPKNSQYTSEEISRHLFEQQGLKSSPGAIPEMFKKEREVNV